MSLISQERIFYLDISSLIELHRKCMLVHVGEIFSVHKYSDHFLYISNP